MSYQNTTLKKYLEQLASRTPTPGGGSAAALTAALGVCLIEMVAQYSKKKNKPKRYNQRIANILKKAKDIRKRLGKLVDLDARAYMKVVKTRGAKPAVRKKALKAASDIPLEVCQLCYQSVDLTTFLALEGNKNLISDIEVALELLLAAFKSARINVHINQT